MGALIFYIYTSLLSPMIYVKIDAIMDIFRIFILDV